MWWWIGSSSAILSVFQWPSHSSCVKCKPSNCSEVLFYFDKTLCHCLRHTRDDRYCNRVSVRWITWCCFTCEHTQIDTSKLLFYYRWMNSSHFHHGGVSLASSMNTHDLIQIPVPRPQYELIPLTPWWSKSCFIHEHTWSHPNSCSTTTVWTHPTYTLVE